MTRIFFLVARLLLEMRSLEHLLCNRHQDGLAFATTLLTLIRDALIHCWKNARRLGLGGKDFIVVLLFCDHGVDRAPEIGIGVWQALIVGEARELIHQVAQSFLAKRVAQVFKAPGLDDGTAGIERSRLGHGAA